MSCFRNRPDNVCGATSRRRTPDIVRIGSRRLHDASSRQRRRASRAPARLGCSRPLLKPDQSHVRRHGHRNSAVAAETRERDPRRLYEVAVALLGLDRDSLHRSDLDRERRLRRERGRLDDVGQVEQARHVHGRRRYGGGPRHVHGRAGPRGRRGAVCGSLIATLSVTLCDAAPHA